MIRLSFFLPLPTIGTKPRDTARQANMYIKRVSSMDFFSLIRRVQKNTYCLTTRIHSGRTVRAVHPNTILLLSVFILDCWVGRGQCCQVPKKFPASTSEKFGQFRKKFGQFPKTSISQCLVQLQCLLKIKFNFVLVYIIRGYHS